jgi:hypothetical protein
MGFLDGEIAELVGTALVDAGMSKPAVLTKLTRGGRDPSRVSAGLVITTDDFTAQGFVANLSSFQIRGTLIADVNRVVKLYGSTISGGVIPAPGDRITIEGTTSTIVDDDGGGNAVTRDAASAVYTCQCR